MQAEAVTICGPEVTMTKAKPKRKRGQRSRRLLLLKRIGSPQSFAETGVLWSLEKEVGQGVNRVTVP